MKILVRTPNWLGDLVMSFGFFNRLQEIHPDSEVDIIIKEQLADLAKLVPGVSKVHLFSKTNYPGISGVRKFSKEIKQHHSYDIFYCLPDSFSSALMGFFIGAKKRIGYKNEFRSFLLTTSYNKIIEKHRVEQYIDLLNGGNGKSVHNISITTNEPVSSLPLGLKIADNTPKIVLNFNSEASSRRMPMSQAVKLLNKTQENINCNVILIGSERDRKFNKKLLNLVNDKEKVLDLSGQTNLLELASVLKYADLLISVDSGPVHLANSLGVKTVVLFGAGNENNTGPYHKQHARVIRLIDLSCAPCVSNTCELYDEPKCLADLDSSQIVEEAKKLLSLN